MIAEQRDSIRLLQAALVAAIALPLSLFTYAAYVSYVGTHRTADSEIERSNDVTNEHALKVFESVQRTIAEVDEATRALSDEDIAARGRELHERLKRIADDSAEIKSVWVFGKNGRSLVNSLTFPADDTDFSDRDYFKAHTGADIGTFVGSVLRPRAPYGGAPFFGISRRRSSPNGAFNGVIQISVLPEYFETFYQRLSREPGEYASLIRDDGTILARYPHLDREAKLAPQGALYQAMLREPKSGHVTLVSAIDGTGRSVAYRKLANLPVFVLSGLETETVKRRWISQLTTQLAFGVPATAALIGILFLALKRTRRLYAEAAARVAAEDALKNAQRLEAVGQLTGGVAHDFNNLLMVIGGSADRARRKATDPDVEKSLSMISSAVQKGQTLTRRLLSFSRRQTLTPKVADIHSTVSSFTDVLRQSLRGNVDLVVKASATPLMAEVDVDELEIALLNLVLNARDAMPSGGRITLSFLTRRFEAGSTEGLTGDFVGVCAADTGDGIRPEIRDRIFEPYFTTKSDKGTGLGLSQV
ncbi:MAG: hybrid sensor histidine kinase/response regulator, partial [Pseudolabrys sp.]|nr:hybrid sensor histidine kinase/response regulator [Pseudolabrys sp.]